ncbi:MAG: DUF2437 domain-containing protein [Pirellulaceae bacterium]
MKLAKFKQPNGIVAAGLVEGETITAIDLSAGKFDALSDLLDAKDILAAIDYLPKRNPIELSKIQLLPPIDRQKFGLPA